ncbi:pectate lyase-like adhesive domain-containing protein [Paenibacillus larvae]|uniref:WxL domain-containing protein n=4 Tax=Paenibacillus larvae TaxID=1464 RepID=A0A6C0QR41_9BACL|nr:pectate lyase-like adhesive domain-containing protein [Paenibacillus larvae]AQR79524.1 hypothetical protein BXP28_22200 [Paenibacillus larvae subsp. larvae]AVF23280.1 hypothetical protein ERICI_03523 [Paenibacillus larvae subsp. larvae]ETK26039.1 putative secreted protein [Paenibacillus larvae subsp. larvae DSM 25719]MCY7477987.1 WxL domain-containing protein [Paenibacillus larvae]MCY7491582.1 WxL domain-containing protein [Paenibacillus larvae]
MNLFSKKIFNFLLVFSILLSQVSFLPNAIAEGNVANKKLKIGNVPAFELPEDSIVVTTYDELKSAIESDNGITTVYMGADFNLSGGIVIPKFKKTITLSGKNPNTGIVHTLTESMSSGTDSKQVINLRSNEGPKEIHVKDITIIGKSYYGPVHVESRGVTLTYENVTYTGPQLCHNIYGKAKFLGNNNITIKQVVSGSAPAQEVAEAQDIIIGGNLRVSHNNNNAMFWMGQGSGSQNSFTVLEDADVEILALGNGMFYRNGSIPVSMTIEKNAKLSVITSDRLFRNNAGGSISIAEGADVMFEKNGGNNELLWLSGDLTVATGASLIMQNNNTRGNLIQFASNGAKAVFDNPLSVLLYTKASDRMFSWSSGTGQIILNSELVNYWRTAGTGDRNDLPLYHWNMSDGSNVAATIGTNGRTTNIISTNAGILASEFAVEYGKVIALGHLDVTINPLTDAMDHVTGTSTPNSKVFIDYTEGGVAKVLEGITDISGNYSIPVPNGFIKPYIKVKATANYVFKTKSTEEIIVSDVTPPTGDPITQIISLNEPFPTDVTKLVENIKDHSDGTPGAGITATLKTFPDTSVFGPTTAKVELKDKAGNSTIMTVPVFIKDSNTEANSQYALRANHFSMDMDEFSGLNKGEINTLILTKSKAEGWEVETGKDITSRVTVESTDLNNQIGSYHAVLNLGNIKRTIIIQVIGTLKFNKIQNVLTFQTSTLTTKETIIPRDEWNISVSDTRGTGSKWKLTASISQPLTSTKDSSHTLPNALVYVDSNGVAQALNSSPSKVYEYTTGSDTIIPIEWSPDKGLLLKLVPTDAYAYEEYATTIYWTLNDAP